MLVFEMSAAATRGYARPTVGSTFGWGEATDEPFSSNLGFEPERIDLGLSSAEVHCSACGYARPTFLPCRAWGFFLVERGY